MRAIRTIPHEMEIAEMGCFGGRLFTPSASLRAGCRASDCGPCDYAAYYNAADARPNYTSASPRLIRRAWLTRFRVSGFSAPRRWIRRRRSTVRI